MKWLLIGFIKFWRKLISPLYGNVCKYHPSCSEYGLEAVQLHGAIQGSAMIFWRILRCNPFSNGGVDYVKDSPRWHEWQNRLAEGNRVEVNDAVTPQVFASATVGDPVASRGDI